MQSLWLARGSIPVVPCGCSALEVAARVPERDVPHLVDRASASSAGHVHACKPDFWAGVASGPRTSRAHEQSLRQEDFGRYGRRLHIPSLLIRLGATPEAAYLVARNPGGRPVAGLHTSGFVPDMPRALRTGVRALVALVRTLLLRVP